MSDIQSAIRNDALTGSDPVLPTPYRIGEAGAAAIAASARAAADLWELRTGESQTVAVDRRHAAAAMRSATYLRIDGNDPPESWDPFTGHYATGDGRHVFLHCNFRHHRDGILDITGVPVARPDKEALAEAIRGWEARALEDAAAEAGLCGTMVRTIGEWEGHAHRGALAALPPVSIERIGDGPEQPPDPDGRRPLAGIPGSGPDAGSGRSDLRTHPCRTRGRRDADSGSGISRRSRPPSSTRATASCPHSSTSAKSRAVPGCGRWAADADIFLQGYRPGALAARGFGPGALGPGKIHVSVSAYGHAGPLSPRRGFDSVVQNATGMTTVQGSSDAPRNLPVQPLDYCAGYLAAWGAMVALRRRAEEGGSWHVQVSLAGMAEWIRGLGTVDDWRDVPRDLAPEEIAGISMESDTPFGRLAHLAPRCPDVRDPAAVGSAVGASRHP